MRHRDRVYGLFSDAIRRAARDNSLTDQLPPSTQEGGIIVEIWQAAEQRGAYAVIDRMLYRFGRYRLADCTAYELHETLHTINACLVPPPRRPHIPPRPTGHSQPEEQQ